MANPFNTERNKKIPKIKETITENLGLNEEIQISPTADSLLGKKLKSKPEGKSYGFYLDKEVDEALGLLAKQKKTSKSKVLNTLLRSILLDD